MRLILLPRPRDTLAPAPGQRRLRIDHLVRAILPELHEVPTCLRSRSRLRPEIDLSHYVEPALPEVTLSVCPMLQLFSPLGSQLAQLLRGSLGVGQGLGPLPGPFGSRIHGLFHQGLPRAYCFVPDLQRLPPPSPP